MGQVSTIGLDIAKNLFQIHGVDADGTVVIRKRLSRVNRATPFWRERGIPDARSERVGA